VQTQRAPAATPRPPVPAQAPAPRVRHHHHKRAAHRRTNATVDHIPDILQPAAAHTNESPAVALLLASLALLLAAAAAASLLRLSAAAAAAIGLALALGAQPAAATTIKWTPYGTAGEDGWYVSDVYVNWIVSDYTPPITDDNCPRTVHLTSDTRGTQVSCSITTSQDGQSSLTTPPIKIDTTPPAGVAAAAARPADANGWYRRPVDIAWSGTDATSGIASCTTLTYAGPDGANTPVAGGCRDLAGNSATGGFSLDYDATAPTVARLTATPENRRVKLAWTPSADTVSVEVMRSPGLSGGRSSEVYSGVLPAFSKRRGLPLRGARTRRCRQRGDAHGARHPVRPDTGRGQATAAPAHPPLAEVAQGPLLQRAAGPRRAKGAEHLANGGEAQAPPPLGLPWPPAAAPPRPLPLVRLAGLRVAQRPSLRPADRPERVHSRALMASPPRRGRFNPSATRRRRPRPTRT
jgi:hypothetical protein